MRVSRKPGIIASWQRAGFGANLQHTRAVVATRASRQYKLLIMSAPSDIYPLLESIGSPADLRRLPPAKLGDLAPGLREFFIHNASNRGGHFSPGLGDVGPPN